VDVYVFAAGVDPNGLDISLQQNLLKVSGERRIDSGGEDVDVHPVWRGTDIDCRKGPRRDRANPERVAPVTEDRIHLAPHALELVKEIAIKTAHQTKHGTSSNDQRLAAGLHGGPCSVA
jgi:hypothetical protein